jgi:hypothetical protein
LAQVAACQGPLQRQSPLHPPPQCGQDLAARKDDEAWRWHEHFGHLHFDTLHRLARDDMVHGLPVIDHVGQFYDMCVITKHRRTPFPAEA